MYSSVAIYDSGLLRQITDSQRRFGGLELYGSILGVRVYKTAEKQLMRIPKKDIKRIADALDSMEANPFNGDIVKLGGEDNV